ncbi:hypothetical protein [Rhodothermus profundi]|uniref:Uncharacterized protein n=1 Tax=Rhodothermus profundi TaxID=633813 RepID=A0A1M6Q0S4_9BACT|nr:hypothetical protein [Rhodothermus profundi]SHK13819.1 hypothetical protein SAMN04488087_0418 [Rhodothermus profundi]
MDGPYYSRFHPHRTPDLRAFRTALLRPLATCLLTLAGVLLVRVLQTQPLGLWLVLGLPAALLLAMGWTAYWMQQTPAELHLHPEGLVLRSVWDVLTGRQPPPRPLLGVRRDHDRTHLFCADALYTLRDLDWPEAPQLVKALRARFAYTGTASASSCDATARSSSAPA